MKLEANQWGEIVDTVGICGLPPHDAAGGHGVLYTVAQPVSCQLTVYD